MDQKPEHAEQTLSKNDNCIFHYGFCRFWLEIIQSGQSIGFL